MILQKACEGLLTNRKGGMLAHVPVRGFRNGKADFRKPDQAAVFGGTARLRQIRVMVDRRTPVATRSEPSRDPKAVANAPGVSNSSTSPSGGPAHAVPHNGRNQQPPHRTVTCRSDEPTLEIGDAISIEEGLLGWSLPATRGQVIHGTTSTILSS